RGLIFEEEGGSLMIEAKAVVNETLNAINTEAKGEILEVNEEVRRALRRFYNKVLDRKPVILPLIIEL
ncbi:MAG: ribonuclease J, partial [Deltaproteobacteria bacterium]